MAFHGKPRFDQSGAHAGHDDHAADDHDHHGGPPRESPWVVTVPLILLAIPSIYTGWVYIEPMLFGDYFGKSIVVRPEHAVLEHMKAGWHGAWGFVTHGLVALPFWLAVAGIVSAWYLYLVNPGLPARLAARLGPINGVLQNNYYFDRFNEWFFAGGSRKFGGFLSNVGDGLLIEGLVNGSARFVGWWAALLRQMQSGYVYHYAFTMIIGLFALLTWWVVR